MLQVVACIVFLHLHAVYYSEFELCNTMNMSCSYPLFVIFVAVKQGMNAVQHTSSDDVFKIVYYIL
jgi:hypothetical protein